MDSRRRFIVGGTVPPNELGYVQRSADAQLLDLCLRGEFAYVLTSRQMGKSSLMARTAEALAKRDLVSAIVDLTTLGAVGVTAEQWYLGVIAQIESSCGENLDIFAWWERQAAMSLAHRFTHFFTDLLLTRISSRIVVFVDEIDTTLGLRFTDDFFSVIRALHNGRANNPELTRISFVLLGVATPGELISDQTRTPFNIGTRVELNDFTLTEVGSLVAALIPGHQNTTVLDRIYHWTGGHPYLTQRVCELLFDSPIVEADNIDHIVSRYFLSDKVLRDSHFQFVFNYVVESPLQYRRGVFETYEMCLRDKAVVCNDASPAHNRLRLSGLLKKEADLLRVRNELYRRLFDMTWVRSYRPTAWTERNKRRALLAGIGLTTLLALSMMAFAISNYLEKKFSEQLASNYRTVVEDNVALVLADQSDKVSGEDDESSRSALLALAAHSLSPSAKVEGALRNALIHLADTALSIGAKHVRDVAISPSGSVIATGLANGAVLFWSTETGHPLGRTESTDSSVQSLAFLSDRDCVVSANDQQGLSICSDSESGKAFEHLRISPIHSALPRSRRLTELLTGEYEGSDVSAKSPDMRYEIYSLGKNGAVLLDFERETLKHFHFGQPGQLASKFVFSGDGSLLASAANDRTVRIWNVAQIKPITSPLYGHRNDVTSMYFSPDGRLLVTADNDGVMIVWDTASGRQIGRPFLRIGSKVKGVAFAPDSKKFIWWNDAEISFWDSRQLETNFRRIDAASEDILAAAYFKNGDKFVTAGKDHLLRIWNANTGMQISEFANGRDNVTKILITPDSERIVTLSVAGRVKIWNANMLGGVRNIVAAHQGGVSDIEISPDGSRLVTSGIDRTVRIWDAHTLGAIATLQSRHSEPLFAVAFSKDGNRVITSSGNGWLLWDRRSASLIGGQKHAQFGYVYAVALSPDGEHMASGAEDGSVQMWNTTTGNTEGGPLWCHTYAVRALAYSPDGQRLASAAADGSVCVWDARNGALIGHTDTDADNLLRSIAFSPDGRRLMSAGTGHYLTFWDSKSLARIGSPVRGHDAWVRSASFNPKREMIASTDLKGFLRFWHSKTRAPIGEAIQAHLYPILQMAFSPDGRQVVTASADGSIRHWDSESHREIVPQSITLGSELMSVTFSRDGSFFAAGSSNGHLTILDAESGKPAADGTATTPGLVNAVIFSKDGSQLFSGGIDDTVRQWPISKRSTDSMIFASHGSVLELDLSADGQLLIAVDENGDLIAWDKASGKIWSLRIVQGDSWLHAAISPDGRRIASTNDHKGISIWDTQTHQLINQSAEQHDGEINSVNFSPDGRTIVTASSDQTLGLWDTESLKLLRRIRGPSERENIAKFTPDGKRIVSAGGRFLRVWNALNGTEVGDPMPGSKVPEKGIAIYPDGYAFVSGGYPDGALRIWPLSEQALADALCKRVRKNLSHKDWNDAVKSAVNSAVNSADIPYRRQCPNSPIPPDSPEVSSSPPEAAIEDQ